MDETKKDTIKLIKGNREYNVSIDELANEIAQCLQIENLNFLIGAGCSSYCDTEGKENTCSVNFSRYKNTARNH